MESKPFKSVDDQIVILREREWKSVITNLLAEFFVKLDTIDCLDTPIPIVLFKIEITLRAMIGHELGRVDPYLHLSPHKLGKKLGIRLMRNQLNSMQSG